MGIFISEDIVSENGLTATTLNTTTLNVTTLSATTLYGDGTNITNVSGTITPGGVENSLQFNNNTFFSGSSNLIYSEDSLSHSGTTRLNGNFFLDNSPSTEIRIQWFGSIGAGTAPGIIWTNMPALPTTWLHQTSGTLTGDATYIVDLTEYTHFRFTFQRQVQGTAASTLAIQYSFDNSTWEITPLVTLAVGTGTGPRDSGWTSIPVNARTFIYIRLIGAGGNGTADPRFSPPTIIFR